MNEWESAVARTHVDPSKLCDYAGASRRYFSGRRSRARAMFRTYWRKRLSTLLDWTLSAEKPGESSAYQIPNCLGFFRSSTCAMRTVLIGTSGWSRASG